MDPSPKNKSDSDAAEEPLDLTSFMLAAAFLGVLVVAGGMILQAVVGEVATRVHLLRRGVPAVGQVLSQEETRSRDAGGTSRTTTHLLVSVVDADQNALEFRTSLEGRREALEGKEVDVLLHPETPADSMLAEEAGRLAGRVALLLFVGPIWLFSLRAAVKLFARFLTG